jgi:hypothetical protein
MFIEFQFARKCLILNVALCIGRSADKSRQCASISISPSQLSLRSSCQSRCSGRSGRRLWYQRGATNSYTSWLSRLSPFPLRARDTLGSYQCSSERAPLAPLLSSSNPPSTAAQTLTTGLPIRLACLSELALACPISASVSAGPNLRGGHRAPHMRSRYIRVLSECFKAWAYWGKSAPS